MAAVEQGPDAAVTEPLLHVEQHDRQGAGDQRRPEGVAHQQLALTNARDGSDQQRQEMPGEAP